MIIELERGRQATLDQIRDLAVRFGNRVELSEGTGVYDTVHIIGDSREFASRESYILGLPGVRAAWQPTGGYKNIARVVRGNEGKALHRERRVVEVKGLDGKVPVKKAKLEVLSGSFAGRELELNKALTTLGRPGIQVAAITRRQDGYFIVHVDADKPDNYPLVNGTAIGSQARKLTDNDVIHLAGVKMGFFEA